MSYDLRYPPGHFYSPIPDVDTLPDSLWQPSDMPGVEMRDESQLKLMREVIPQYWHECESIPIQPTADQTEFFLANDMFVGADALAYYSLIRHYRPARIVEVGAGHTTRLAARAAMRNGVTELVAIEPYPDDILRAGFPGLTRLITEKVQDVDPGIFDSLQANDILFTDSSHVAKAGSDVLHLFHRVFPRLAPGVLVHVHDIFFPFEYPRHWITEMGFYWSEQYLLQAFLAFNSQFEILLCNSYLTYKYREEVKTAFPRSNSWGGCSFWMRRRL